MLQFCLSLQTAHKQIHIFSSYARSCKVFSYSHFDIFLWVSQHFYTEVVSIMPNPWSGEFGFHLGVCSPRQVGNSLRTPPYPVTVGHCLAPLLRPVRLGWIYQYVFKPGASQLKVQSVTVSSNFFSYIM